MSGRPAAEREPVIGEEREHQEHEENLDRHRDHHELQRYSQPVKSHRVRLRVSRIVPERSRMLLYRERNAAEAVIARAADGTMATINGSGGVLCSYPNGRIRHRMK